MKHNLSSLTTKALALASIAASIALTAHALPAASAEAHAAVHGANSPATGTEALALGAVQWQRQATNTQDAMPVSTVSLQALERVGADLSNANTGVLPVVSFAASEPGVAAIVHETVVKSDPADDVLLEPAYSALVAALAADAQG